MVKIPGTHNCPPDGVRYVSPETTLLNPTDGGPPYTTEESLNLKGYDYEYTVLSENFELRLNPTSGRGMHFYTDKTREVRYRNNSPADESSSVLYGN